MTESRVNLLVLHRFSRRIKLPGDHYYMSLFKPRNIAVSAAIILLLALLYQWINAGESATPPEESTEMKSRPVYTRMDSMVFLYDSLLGSRIDSMGSVGGAVVVTHRQDIKLLKTFGVKEAETADSVNQQTLFRLASVSKTVTGVLAGILDYEGILDLDDRVVEHLPAFKLKDSVNTADLTIQNLLTHTSGLVPHAYDNMVEAGVPLRTILDSLFRVNISGIPGTLYGYQNVMFSLYDTICRAETGRSYDELVRSRVFEPFGMNSASTGFAPFKNSSNKALPHARYGGRYRPLPLNGRYYNTNPAAGVNASIADMAQFLLALGNAGKLDPAVADTVFHPRIQSPLRWIYLRRWDKVESKEYALGWRIIGYHGLKIAYHGGYVQGYKAEIAYCPEEDLGIAFLTNSPNRVASEIVPLLLDLYVEHFPTEKRMPGGIPATRRSVENRIEPFQYQ